MAKTEKGINMILEREIKYVQDEFLSLFQRQRGLLQMYSDEQLQD